MSKRLLTSFDLSGRPITSETWLHLQQSYNESISDCISNLISNYYGIYDSSKVYILWGCSVSNNGVTWTINQGALFYNGEVYRLDSSSIPYSIGTLVVNISLSYYSGINPDPIVYKDLSLHSPHQIAKVLLVEGTTGTGDLTGDLNSDYINLLTLLYQKLLPASLTMSTGWLPSNDLSVYKNDKLIKLVGSLGTTGIPPSGNVFTLPSGFRPSCVSPLLFTVVLVNGASVALNISISISNSGIVSIVNSSDIPTGAVWILHINNISFLV